MLQHREVVFFCDNSSALSAAVNGYTRSPHMASLSNALHLTLAGLRCSAFFEWVPSEANCADLPSRPQGVAERQFYDDLELKQWPSDAVKPRASDRSSVGSGGGVPGRACLLHIRGTRPLPPCLRVR